MSSHSGIRVLAVDDEPVNLSLLEAALDGMDFRVEKAFSGLEAVERVGEFRPDVILLDVMMPDLNGFEVCEIIRSNPENPYIPIIFLTAARTAREDVIRGLDLGGDDYITKPFQRLELLARIRAVLRVKRIYDELAKAKKELSRYVSLSTMKMVERIISDQDAAVDGSGEVTVLFSDIRAFTRITEDMAPAEVFKLLNSILSIQIKVIEYHGGVIDKLTGDEIMAVFEGEQMAVDALQCADDIIENLTNPMLGLGTAWVGVGIGVNSGPVYIGGIGSESVRDYTIVGNTVNTSARLCGYARKFQVLFTEATRTRLPEDELNFRPVGPVPLKGLKEAIPVYELLTRWQAGAG